MPFTLGSLGESLQRPDIGRHSQLGLILEDLKCFLAHWIVINWYNILYFAHLVTFFSATKHVSTAKCENSLYVEKFQTVLLIL